MIDTLSLPDPDDRHVLAAAIHAKAQTIVTFNAKDFPDTALAPHRITRRHPDTFLSDLLTRHPSEVVAALARQRRRLNNPPQTVKEFLETLGRQGLPETVKRLRPHVPSL